MLPIVNLSKGLRCWTFGICLVFAVSGTFVRIGYAAEGANASETLESMVAPQSWLTISLHRPSQLFENQMVQQLYAAALQSRQVQSAINSDQADLYRKMIELVEHSTGETFNTGLQKLTDGGLYVGVSGDNPPRVDVAIGAQDEAALATFVTQFETWVIGRVAPQLTGESLPTMTYGNVKYRALGPARYAVVGNVLLMSNREEGLHELIDRSRHLNTSASASTTVDAPLARLVIAGDKLRSTPNLQAALGWPASDPNLVTFLGGWLDALRRCEHFDVSLHATSSEMNVVASLPYQSSSSAAFQETVGLEGYFAPVDGPGIAPLLIPEGTIYSSSWYRDYRALWNQRADSVIPDVLKRVEEGNELTKTQFSQFGVQATLSELLSTLGPQFRSVVARQFGSPYNVELNEQFPAAAIVIRLQDEEGFRRHFIPLLKTLNLIAMFSQAQMVTQSEKYRDVDLNVLMFADDEQAVSKGNRFRFHFSPTFCISHGHFLSGSSVDLIKRLIDELDIETTSASSSQPAAGTTELQMLSAAEADVVVRELRQQIVYRLLISQGLAKEVAEGEADLFSKVLKSIGTVTTAATRSPERFEYQLHIKHPAHTSE
ncbi:MAG: hypothetical protein O2955_06875 [Planctomycetota bacterium]|nr:hypothetical protein [Planctomycetota bacterium]MDA1212219.1 hypothetical protein [Planctomycetota bacterium]